MIGLSKMHNALCNIAQFGEEKWSDEGAKKKAVRHLYAALNHWGRKGTARDPLAHIDRAIAALERASKVEKKEVERLRRGFVDALYGGTSKTPYSDAIEAQKRMPDQEYIWAFRKMLQEYRKEVGRRSAQSNVVQK